MCVRVCVCVSVKHVCLKSKMKGLFQFSPSWVHPCLVLDLHVLHLYFPASEWPNGGTFCRGFPLS